MITHTAQKMKDFFIGIEEVAYSLAGYVAKKLLKCIECESCKIGINLDQYTKSDYFELLSRGVLNMPSMQIVDEGPLD